MGRNKASEQVVRGRVLVLHLFLYGTSRTGNGFAAGLDVFPHAINGRTGRKAKQKYREQASFHTTTHQVGIRANPHKEECDQGNEAARREQAEKYPNTTVE